MKHVLQKEWTCLNKVIIGLLLGLNSKDSTKNNLASKKELERTFKIHQYWKGLCKDSTLCGNMICTVYLDVIGQCFGMTSRSKTRPIRPKKKWIQINDLKRNSKPIKNLEK